MEFFEFEQLVLRVLFETDEPVNAPYIAYLAGVPIALAERHLARMVEQGALRIRCDTHGAIEFVFPGRRPPARRPMELQVPASSRPSSHVATSVLLTLLVPGAGHIYTGRSRAGFAWMASTFVGYACWFLPGLFLHGLCLVSAAQTRQRYSV